MSVRRRPTLGGSVFAASVVLAATAVFAHSAPAPQTITPAAPAMADGAPALFANHCASCHNDIDQIAQLSLDDLRSADLGNGDHGDAWE